MSRLLLGSYHSRNRRTARIPSAQKEEIKPGSIRCSSNSSFLTSFSFSFRYLLMFIWIWVWNWPEKLNYLPMICDYAVDEGFILIRQFRGHQGQWCIIFSVIGFNASVQINSSVNVSHKWRERCRRSIWYRQLSCIYNPV